ncbi:MAG TPA: GH3 auxin-responsive promoter family protein [Myxococcaceae bacterium]
MWFETSVRWRARLTLRSLRSAWRGAGAAEDRWLLGHLSENARSLFGLAHRFSEVTTVSAFQRAVPVRTLAEAQRDAAELRSGLRRGLTIRPPVCLAVSQDGELPLAAESQREGARLWRLWAARVEAAHPGALAGHVGLVPEGASGLNLRTRGIPVLAGELAIPWMPSWRRAVPARVAAVRDPTLRAFLAARFALGRDLTLLTARSAADLAAFGKLIQDHAPSLIRAIRDGTLGVFACEQPRLCKQLLRGLRPDPDRARALDRAAERLGKLRPVDAWPRLKALAVRSGAHPRGSLWPWYGSRPVVESGLFVGPERIGLPMGGLDGPCALTSPGLTEFLPVGGGEPVRQHQLREGESYQVIVTTPGGLYRAASPVWVRAAGRREGAALVESAEPPLAWRQAPPHVAS